MLDAPPATSRTRSSVVASPMKYRPPVSPAPLSTLQVVSPGPTPAVRKHPSSSASSTISNRGAKTMYIFRQSAVGNRLAVLVGQRAQREADVVLGVVVAAREPDAAVRRRTSRLARPCGVVRRVLASTGTVSWQDRTASISPLPSLPIHRRGRRAVLNAMVSVVPLAVASITLDWSGPVTAQFVGVAVDRVREVLAPPIQRSRAGERATADRRQRRSPAGIPMVRHARPAVHVDLARRQWASWT